MTVLTSSPRLPGVQPFAALVEIELVGTNGASVPGYVTGTGQAVQSQRQFHADGKTALSSAVGEWAVDLTPNASIQPAGTVYRIVEQRGRSGSTTHIVSVPAAGGPYTVLQCLTDVPGSLPMGPLLAHLTDAADAHDASAISVAAISGLSSADVQAALAEHQTAIAAKVSLTDASTLAELQAAISAASSAGGGVIRVSVPITIGATVVTVPDGVVLRCEGRGVILATGDGGVVFSGQNNVWGNVLRIRRTSIGWNTTDSTSVLVTLLNCLWGSYEFPEWQNGETGLLLKGDGSGTSLCTITLGRGNDNKRGIRAEVANGGYVNQVMFIGGSVRISNYGGTAGTRYLDLGASNGLTFWATNLEGSAPERTVDITSGANIAFNYCRWESSTGVWFGAASRRNHLNGGVGLELLAINDSAPAGSNVRTVGFGGAARVTKTGGSYTVNGTSYVDLDTSTDLVLGAVAGQWVEVGACVAWQNEATYGWLDVVTLSGGNYLSGAGSGGHGVTSWVGPTSQLSRTGGSILYLLQAADISAGAVTLRFKVKTLAATNKTLLAVAADPLVLWARIVA